MTYHKSNFYGNCEQASEPMHGLVRLMKLGIEELMTRLWAITFLFAIGPVASLADPLPDPITENMFIPVNRDEAILGQLLFYDPILSGNRNIACATCHHPDFATSDGVSLGLGEGGIGVGPKRRGDAKNMPVQRVPRNSPALFNLGANQFTVLFHDGRIEVSSDMPSGFRTPMDDDMLDGFDSILSAQTMFPVLSPDEMAGHDAENDVAKAVRQGLITGNGGAWDLLAKRVAAIPEYAQRFKAVYDHIDAANQIRFTDISNAIAKFIAQEWRSDTSPFDAYLRDPSVLLPPGAEAGMNLFYGKAKCSACHSGAFQTDHKFYAMAAPQLGPGKAATFENHAKDTGRMRVTGDSADAYAFRTPSLRNVMQTGPWGHAGSHSEMMGFLADHLDPSAAIERFANQGTERSGVLLPPLDVDDWREMDDPIARENIRNAAVVKVPVALDNAEIASLVSFLRSLDDPQALSGRMGIPPTVPSGLSVGGFGD